MKKNIYLAIIARLKAAEIGIAHFDLWNNNTAILEKSRGFRLPAVFVEFEPVEWQQQQQRVRSGNQRIRLHIVTATLATAEEGGRYQDKALERLDLSARVAAAIAGLSGEGFNTFMSLESITDHDHEQVAHDVECFVTRITDTTAQNRPSVASDIKPSINTL